MVQWFVCIDEQVEGPFSTEELKSAVASGRYAHSCLVWGKPQGDWRPIKWWLQELPNLLTHTNTRKDDRLWHYAVDGTSHGPLTRDALIAELKSSKHVGSDILLWTKGMKAWAPMFEFHDIMDAIGVNRRQHPRANISGRVVVRIGDNTSVGQLLTISEGGFGADQIGELASGQTVSVDIQSQSFYETLHCRAEVRYINENGFVGFRFQNLNVEARGAIIQYVKSVANRQTKMPLAA